MVLGKVHLRRMEAILSGPYLPFREAIGQGKRAVCDSLGSLEGLYPGVAGSFRTGVRQGAIRVLLTLSDAKKAVADCISWA
jgi:hypothetical protein